MDSIEFYGSKMEKEHKMGIPHRLFSLSLFLFLIVLFHPHNATTQPFGILSKQGGQKPQKQILSSPGGKFVFGQASNSNKDLFMLDTTTGRLWKISERGDIGIFLKNIPYCNSEGKCSSIPEKDPNSNTKRGKEHGIK